MATRALIVDDETVVREVLRVQFEGWGFEVTAVATASEGIQLAASGEYDLVLAELQLLDGSGLDVLSSARGSRKDVPVIITAENWTAEQRSSVEARGGSTVYKPCDWKRLQQLVLEKLRGSGSEAPTAKSGADS
jgi:DNA-binding response OmpR family regulator